MKLAQLVVFFCFFFFYKKSPYIQAVESYLYAFDQSFSAQGFLTSKYSDRWRCLVDLVTHLVLSGTMTHVEAEIEDGGNFLS